MRAPTSLDIEGAPASHWPAAQNRGGQNGKKHAESSHWLSFAAMPGEDRESRQAQLALSPNSGPRPVLRPLGFALPEPLRRPADPNSPGRIANPSYNRSVMGKFPSAGCPKTARTLTRRDTRLDRSVFNPCSRDQLDLPVLQVDGRAAAEEVDHGHELAMLPSADHFPGDPGERAGQDADCRAHRHRRLGRNR